MGFWKKIKFWKRRRNDVVATQDNSTSTENLSCEASTQVQSNLTLTSEASTQTCDASVQEGSRTDGGALVEQEMQKLIKNISQYEEVINDQEEKIRKLQDQLAEQEASDVLGRIRMLEEDIRSYADRPVVNWADDCECKSNVLQVADILKTVAAQNLQFAAATSSASCSKLQNPGVSVATKAAADEECLQAARAEIEEKSSQIRRLNEENARLVDKYTKMKRHLNAKIDDIHQEHRREMDNLKRQSEKEKERLLQKIRDMRDEIISEKEKRGDVHRAREQVTALRSKYYKETQELQRQVRHLRQQIGDMNKRRPQPRTVETRSTTSQTRSENVQGVAGTRRRLHRQV